VKPKLTIPGIKGPRIPPVRWRVPIVRWRIPTIQYRVPYVGWRIPMLGFHGHARLVLAAAVTMTSVAFVIAILFAIQGAGIKPPQWPAPAAYSASETIALGEAQITLGKPLKGRTQTLQLNIAGARLENIIIENVDIGKASGLTNSILVTGDLNVTGDHVAYLECEEVIFDGLVATSLAINEGEAYRLSMSLSTADGKSVSPTISSTPDDITFGGARGALKVDKVEGATYDRIVIDMGATTATCQKLEFKNVRAFGAGVSINGIKTGSLSIVNSLIGSGSGINTADLTVGNTFLVGSFSDSTAEQGVSVK
jgi:hypothetical protein